jgi:hypothetical protein
MKLLIMKRLLLLVFLGVLPAVPALATDANYINNSSIISPPMIAPQIDATNFINNGLFSISDFPLPFETWNTRNWTNNNQMRGFPGFQFDYFDSAGQTNGWSVNFKNSVNATIHGSPYVLVSATNINNKGTLSVGTDGLLSLTGKSIDLTRSTLTAVATTTGQPVGTDLYWGVELTNLLTALFTASEVDSSRMPVQGIIFSQQLHLTNYFTNYITTLDLSGFGLPYRFVNALFLRQTNPAITTEVRFQPFTIDPDNLNPGVDKIVRWRGMTTNRITRVVTTNELYLHDSLATNWGAAPFLIGTRPANFAFTATAPDPYAGYQVQAPGPLAANLFRGTNSPVIVTDAGYGASFDAAPFTVDSTVAGSTYTNIPGRIEITASGPKSSLDLTRTLINGQSYLLLSATNHFVGCTNAVIISPVSDFYLASTNGTLAISNLTVPVIPCLAGTIEAWSGRWTNGSASGTNTLVTYYSVTIIDSQLTPQVTPKIQNLSVSSTNLLIGDALSVFGSLFLDTTRLTISANATNAATPRGELNLTSGDIVWSPSLPKLQYLTNFGKISMSNTVYFAGARTPPWFSGTFDEPYQSFVSHGPISSQGCEIWANYVEASGVNNAGIGPISVQAGVAVVTNGTFQAGDAMLYGGFFFYASGFGGDIDFTCGDLTISNQTLLAGGSIALTVTNKLDDGSLSNSVDVITGKNLWLDYGGINLLRAPAKASLLATTVGSFAEANSEVVNYWAGQDRGGSPNGFVNNAALGRLVLDGEDDGSLFTFLPTGQSNALYVDRLDLVDAATNSVINPLSGELDFTGVNLDPNFTIYYAQALAGGRSIAEKLNGAYGVADTSGGRFRWVSNYNVGFWSSTKVVYSDGTTNRLNTALVQSQTIDSNGNGIPNGSDANPIPVLSPAGLALKLTFTNVPPGAVELSWNSVPNSTNYVFFKPSATATNWRLLTTNSFLPKNPFVVGPAGGRQRVMDPVNVGGLYRVRVDGTAP